MYHVTSFLRRLFTSCSIVSRVGSVYRLKRDMAGFECEFVERPPKAVQSECPICLLILREPYQATCCGKSFCKVCVQPVKANNQPCPTCNGVERFILFHNLGLQQSLYDFRVYCTHKSKGCEWTGELRELDNHLNSDPPADKTLEGCPFTLIKCPLNCSGCKKAVCRKDVKSYITDNLLGIVLSQAAWITSLERQLRENNTLVLQLKAKQDEAERNKLLYGQQVIMLRAKLTELDLKSKRLEEEVKELKIEQSNSPGVPKSQSTGGLPTSRQPDTYISGTFKPAGAVFTMPNFEEFKRDGDYWFSPHFYTHPNGYKMCLGVAADGFAQAKGTHVSVLVHLMRGEFDDQLKWPFCGRVAVNMMNQEENTNHVCWVFRLDDKVPPGVTERVVKETRNMKGFGLHQYLRHTNLRPKYLKNNCLKLYVKNVELF